MNYTIFSIPYHVKGLESFLLLEDKEKIVAELQISVEGRYDLGILIKAITDRLQ